jgi:hypothetical protein
LLNIPGNLWLWGGTVAESRRVVSDALALQREVTEEIDAARAEQESGRPAISLGLLQEAIEKERASLDLLEEGVETVREALEQRRQALDNQAEMLDQLRNELQERTEAK